MDSPKPHKVLAGSTKYYSANEFLRTNQGVIGRTLLYEAIRRGELPHIRIGRRILIPDNALDLMLEAKRRVSDA